ncbi:MAG TPA: NADH-quinone oxidoreductase subunit C [Gallionellaceae bacterium]|nr:NADH-quinone oxidoreductase subunit C [Gallionellaceae bacterium]
MPIKHPNLKLTRLTDAIPAWVGEIAAGDLDSICQQVREGGGRLVALWGSDARKQSGVFYLHVTLMNESGLVCLNVPLPADHPNYPDISRIFPAANRMQRAAYDMLGIYAHDGHDHRKWLRHAAWHSGSFPLRKDFDAANQPLPPCRGKVGMGVELVGRTDSDMSTPSLATPAGSTPVGTPPLCGDPSAVPLQGGGNVAITHEQDDYPFVHVEGQGVHEIPVGPVHAGIIEPGHFRFSVIGEKVLRLEERLGYTHKGIEKRFESMTLQQGAKLAGRVSGDSTVAYAWAYAMAAESIAAVTPSPRALWLRALLLERERVANHLGDLGYLGNDVALAFGFAQFWILKEQVLRNNAALFGHRYLMDRIAPGGVTVELAAEGRRVIEEECAMLEREVHTLRGIYDEHAGMQDRFIGAGRVEPRLAAQLGLCGMAGRASAQAWDARVQFPCAPYDQLDVKMATYRNGDVAARVIVRFDELFESLRLQREIMARLGNDAAEPALLEKLPGNGFGIGLVEGWRGEVVVAIETDAQGNLSRVHPHDPSWQNWPLLEHAVIDNIVPDFPLINKSFNLSYSGQDL